MLPVFRSRYPMQTFLAVSAAANTTAECYNHEQSYRKSKML